MTVLISTLGGSEELIKIGVRVTENVNTVVILAGIPFKELFKGKNVNSEKMDIDPLQKAKDMKRLLTELGLEVKVHQVNPLSFDECIIKTIDLINEYKHEEPVLNVTGGTKTLSLAALTASWMCGAKAFIIQESENGAVRVDLPTSQPGKFSDIGEQGKRILEYLLTVTDSLEQDIELYKNDDELRSLITKNIANGLRVEPQSIVTNLKLLESYNLIKSRRGAIKRGEPSPGKMSVKLWWLTDKGKIYATYFRGTGL
ncbi:hypothetical protein [Methanosalsum natronophilum]|uniref:hypothetical protein n=1 Tax=Methanosalsum natronophilum TaxID=768733 RepID=UPI002169EACF|nr:hypothetical protein [Methanosalsum natronophilum]MCS3924837.1 hypothetical protein [Methanosalsum natronophilum]